MTYNIILFDQLEIYGKIFTYYNLLNYIGNKIDFLFFFYYSKQTIQKKGSNIDTSIFIVRWDNVLFIIPLFFFFFIKLSFCVTN